MDFVRHEAAALGLNHKKVLEVGSLNVNGSARQFFDGPYLGVDMQAGPGVDQVLNAHDLDHTMLLGAPFDLIVCTEMLEHDSAPWLTLSAMRHHVWPGAYLLLTCRGYDNIYGMTRCFEVHEYPQDMWRFSVPGVTALLKHTGWDPVNVRNDPSDPGVFAVATCSNEALGCSGA
jgi:hypothetical protein